MITPVQEQVDSIRADLNQAGLRVGYIVSHHPAVTPALIFREIAGWQVRWIEVVAGSVSSPGRNAAAVLADEPGVAGEAFCLRRLGPGGILRSILSECAASPVRSASGLFATMRMAGCDPRRMVLFACYWARAILISHWLRGHRLDVIERRERAGC